MTIGSVADIRVRFARAIGHERAGAAADGGFRRVAVGVSRGELPHRVLAERGGRVTAGVAREDGSEVVVKLWRLRGGRDLARRACRRTKGTAEWRVGERMYAAGLRVPRPLAYVDLWGHGLGHHEAYVCEHLGPVRIVGRELHALAKEGRTERCRALSDRIAGYTCWMLSSGVIDLDHRVDNFVLDEAGVLYRIDLENAAIHRGPHPPAARLTRMLGGLIGSYAWKARPAPGMADRFTATVLGSCGVRGRAADAVIESAAREIAELHARTGCPVPFSGER
jgi:uncharacterized protein YjhX (UPF0386 family)